MKIPKLFVVTGIVRTEEGMDKWEVWYNGVKFAVRSDLQDAHDHLQKLISLDLERKFK